VPTSPDRSTAAGTVFAVSAAGSVQLGAALAATLFPLVGPVGTVSLRFTGAALVLVLATRPWRARWTRREVRTVVAFGLVFVTMNLSLYVAISRLPLATAVTLEFLGPLGVAIATAVTWGQRGWAVPAAAGVALIGGSLRVHDLVGVVAALGAAGAWASYILVSRRMGTSDHGLAGLALATVLGALLTLPLGALTAGTDLLAPRTLALGLTVGVASSAVPYSLDLLALRRLRTAVFGVLTSLNPALAALAGLVVLGQLPPPRQLVGIALVMCASAGVTLSGRRPRRTARRPPSGGASGEGPGPPGDAVPPPGAVEPDPLVGQPTEDADGLGQLVDGHAEGEGHVRHPPTDRAG
jgi:inner membrane transporter RhtA